MTQEAASPPKPDLEPIQVIQCEDGFVEIFEKNIIGFGTGKAPSQVKEV